MALSRKSMKVIAAMSGFIFFIFLLQMQAVGMGLGQSLLFAMVMALMTAAVGAMGQAYRSYLQRRSMAGKKLPDDPLTAQQQRTVEIDLPFDAAMELALDALKSLDGEPVPVSDDPLVRMEALIPRKQSLRIHETDWEIGTIQAGLRKRWFGLTDPLEFSRIAIQLQRVDEQTTRIRIESKAAGLWNEFDLGENLHYVKHLALYLRRESLPDDEARQWDDEFLGDEDDRDVMRR